MKAIQFLLLLGIANLAFSQNEKPSATIPQLQNQEIKIGIFSDYWNSIPAFNIDKPFQNETPNIKSASWKAAWDEDGLFVRVDVEDDEWYPVWYSGLSDWESDRIEIYIDVTNPLEDGGGAMDGNGNYQIAPSFTEAIPIVGYHEYITEHFPSGNGIRFYDIYDTEGNYSMEYYIPFTAIPTNTGEIIDPLVTTTIGFDVTICDRDSIDIGGNTINRMVWANEGSTTESWSNCDNIGQITFSRWVTDIKETKSNKILLSNCVKDHIEFNTDIQYVKIYNSIGKLIATNKNFSKFMNVSRLTPGTYIVTIKDQKGYIFSESFIKQ